MDASSSFPRGAPIMPLCLLVDDGLGRIGHSIWHSATRPVCSSRASGTRSDAGDVSLDMVLKDVWGASRCREICRGQLCQLYQRQPYLFPRLLSDLLGLMQAAYDYTMPISRAGTWVQAFRGKPGAGNTRWYNRRPPASTQEGR